MKYTVLWFIPNWVHPNHVTVMRFILTPLVLYFIITEQYSIGIPFFLIVAFTDAIDGSLARVRKQITEWGTFYDPVADKILIGSVALLIVAQYINVYFALLIVFLEALIIGGGYIRKLRGDLIPANIFGKTKMILQVVGVTFLLFAVWMQFDLFVDVSVATLGLAVIFAVISLFTYGI